MEKILIDEILVSVLIPVYNCQDYVKVAIESVTSQTHKKLEILIVNDCSTDKSLEVIKTINDSRIKVFSNKKNLGISESLNFLLKKARGKYIARMDADDISLKNRIRKQVKFLESHKNIILCGTAYKKIGHSTKVCNAIDNYKEIEITLLKKNCIGHPTVMLRKKSIKMLAELYDFKMEPAEDYDLWTKLIQKGRITNLNEILLKHRVHQTQISQINSQLQLDKKVEISTNYLENTILKLNTTERKIYKKIILNDKNISFDEFKQSQNLLTKIQKKNKNFDKKLFQKFIYDLELNLTKNYFLRRKKFNPVIFYQYLKVKKNSSKKLHKNQLIKLFFKSLFFHENI